VINKKNVYKRLLQLCTEPMTNDYNDDNDNDDDDAADRAHSLKRE